MVNYLAILVAAVVTYGIGALWYSPILFGEMWMKLSGVKMNKNKSPAPSYVLGFVTSLVTAYVLAMLLEMTNAVILSEGLMLGFWIWLGFMATSMLGSVLWEMKPFKLYVLNAAYSLVTLLAMSAILTVWV